MPGKGRAAQLSYRLFDPYTGIHWTDPVPSMPCGDGEGVIPRAGHFSSLSVRTVGFARLDRAAGRGITLKLMIILGALTAFLPGCFGVHGITEIAASPYPIIYEDDSTARFGTSDDSAFIEVRKADTSGPLEHLAVHYRSLFPGGEIIRPGDREQYVKVNGKNAYKVVFRTKYIRKRKRLGDKDKIDPESIPEGWTPARMEDPVTGRIVRVLHGPVIPQQKILYLVQGDPHIYYVLLRADGDAIKSAKKKFEKFVHEDINYL